MPTDEEAKRAWEGARVRGEFAAFLLPILKEYERSRRKLNGFLKKQVLTEKQWPQLQFCQGQIDALGDLVLQLEELSKPAVERQPQARPTQSD